MTKEEFLSEIDVAKGVRLPYFRGKRHINPIAETARRARAIGGPIASMPIYGGWLFIESQNRFFKDYRELSPGFSKAVNIRRSGKSQLQYLAKRGRVI